MSQPGVIPSALARSLGGSHGGGVFYLHGDDDFRKEEVARILTDAHLDPGIRDFNLDPIRGTEVEPETLASLLATPPMMSPWRVILVREAEGLARSPRTREMMTSLLAGPPPGLALILLARKPSGSSARFYREMEKGARSLEFRAMAPDDAPGWLQDRAQRVHGVVLEPEAARGLAAALGTDLGILARELEKLSDQIGEGEPITAEVVEASGTRLPAVDRWKWIDRVGDRRLDIALDELPDLLAQGESGVGLVIGLATHLLRLGVARSGGKGALERVLEPRQRFLIRSLLEQAGKWEVDELETGLAALARVDRLLKSSSLTDRHLLEEWLLSVRSTTSVAPAGWSG